MIYVGIINVLALSKLRFRSDKMIKAVIEWINYAVIMINVSIISGAKRFNLIILKF